MTTPTKMSKADQKRADRLRDLAAAATDVADAERSLDRAITERDRLLVRYHGNRSRGGLSYGEMSSAAGIGRGRVIQVVQGKSAYSKAQQKKVRGDDA